MEHDELVCEHASVSPLAITAAALLWVAAAAFGALLASALPWAPSLASLVSQFALAIVVVQLVTRSTRRHPLDAFCCAEVDGRRILLHPCDAQQPPLELHLASWNMAKLVAALDAAAPGLTTAPVPERPAVPRRALAGLPGLVPSDRSAPATLAGAALSLGALVAGGLAWSVAGAPARGLRVAAVILWFLAAVPWLSDRWRAGAHVREQRGRVAVRVRREERDVLRLLAPWVHADLHATGGELLLARHAARGFETALFCGAAILGGTLALGSPTPWAAALAALPLLASGYPRPAEHVETWPSSLVQRLEVEGDAATLHVVGDDGAPRSLALRLHRRDAARLAAVIRDVAADVDIVLRTGAERTAAPLAAETSQHLADVAARLHALRSGAQESRRT